MIEMSQAAKAEASPAKTVKELEERLCIRVGSTLRISHAHYDERHTGILEILQLKRSGGWHTLHFQFRGATGLREISEPLDWGYEVLLDGNWRRIHEGVKRRG